MASVPGCAGMSVLGDKSIDVYRNPVKFVEKKIADTKSRIFLSRILNKPTVFIASHAGAREALGEYADKMDLGYQSFMGDVFGDNILYTDGIEAAQLRQLMAHLFNDEAIKNFHSTVDRLVNKFLATIDESDTPVPIYNSFKLLTTEICLTLFLDLDFEKSKELAQQITQLTTKHWHGIISVPMKLKVPLPGFSSYSSGYGKAIEAKESLLKIIDKKLSISPRGFLAKFADLSFPSPDAANNNLLLLTCALVPKALASVMTSFVLAADFPAYEKDDLLTKIETDPDYHDRFLMEVMRMWPPFFGGRRIVNDDFECQGYKIPKGHAVVYATPAIQRDPDVFDEPDVFKPERWRDRRDLDKLMCFGFGPRGCIGRKFVWDILKTSTFQVLSHFTWTIPDKQNLLYKYLPVSRPKEKFLVQFAIRKKHLRLEMKESLSEDSETLFDKAQVQETSEEDSSERDGVENSPSETPQHTCMSMTQE